MSASTQPLVDLGQPRRSTGSGFEVLSRGTAARDGDSGAAETGDGEGKRGEEVLSVQPAYPTHPVPSAFEVVPPTPIEPTTEPPAATPRPPSLHHKSSNSLLPLSSLKLKGRRNSSSSAASSASSSSSSSDDDDEVSEHRAHEHKPGGLHSLLTRLSSHPPVKLTLVNETGLPLTLAHWPVRMHDDEGEEIGCELRSFRGGGVVEGSVPCEAGEGGEQREWEGDDEIEVGRFKAPGKRGALKGHKHSEGWIFFDLTLPPSDPSGRSYLIHLQLHARLSTSGSARVSLGRFDLDSSSAKPVPSGSCGRVEVVREKLVADELRERIPPLLRRRTSSSSFSVSSSLAEVQAGDDSKPSSEADFKDRRKSDGAVTEIRYILTPDVAQVRNVVDDSTKEGRFWVPGKGVVVSSWVSVEGLTVSVIVGNEARYHEHYTLEDHPPASQTLSHRRSASSLKPHPRHHRRSSSSSSLSTALLPSNPASSHPLRTTRHVLEGAGWKSCYLHVRHGQDVLLAKTVKINPLHGAAVGAGVVSTVDSPTVFHPDRNVAISYSFFDSGIARAKELYIYAARRNTNWLGDMIEADPRVLSVPFEKLALAGSHDAGMLGTVSADLLTFLSRGDGSDIPAVALALPLVRFVLGILKTFGIGAARALSNLSMTQKDSIKSQLEMGVRFFDFRPGFCLFDIVDEHKGELRHQHSIVPGVSYEMFLLDVLAFLAENEEEIVVVELKDDGFPFKTDIYPTPSSPPANPAAPVKPVTISMVPSLSDLADTLKRARSSSTLKARDIQVGGAADLVRTIGELLEENRRLIIINRMHAAELEETDRWERADSYTHELYDTDDPLKVLSALNTAHADAVARTAKEEEGAARGTIYQLQATPTAQIWSDIGPSLSFSDASSLLVWSKARMDRVTYPWIAERAFLEDGPVVFLNDFVDPALVEHCVEKSRERVAIHLAKEEQDQKARLRGEA
ncbi:hypothetical protein JCM6882_007378 [Rhodosporidiobolus microsporus]